MKKKNLVTKIYNYINPVKLSFEEMINLMIALHAMEKLNEEEAEILEEWIAKTGNNKYFVDKSHDFKKRIDNAKTEFKKLLTLLKKR